MSELLPHVRARRAAWPASRAVRLMADEDFWDVACDILIPAALEGQINEADRARRLKARLVLEGANGPTCRTADDILADRGILVVPDVICNAGGVTVSYFEWVQDFSVLLLDRGRDQLRLDKIMIGASSTSGTPPTATSITLRTATFAVACERILQAREERGLYP
jgi:glutamate dehydrogenase (NAD(P)+)